MNRALFAAASGMAAQQKTLEAVAENLANASVIGFKGSAATFEEIAAPGGGTLGTAQAGVQTSFKQGKLMRSDGPFDVAIDGSGFFIVRKGSQTAYTRDGSFARNADGTLENTGGWRLEGVRIPQGAASLSVAEDGVVTETRAGRSRRCGRIRIAQFQSPQALRPQGGTLFFATRASGPPVLYAAGRDGGPSVKFGMLEQSNVTIVEAMMQILAAQRAYEANAKGVQAADEMMRIADNLSRD